MAGSVYCKHAVWFRQDGQRADNRVLSVAGEEVGAVACAVFFRAPLSQWQEHGATARQIAFMHEHVKKRSEGRPEMGIALVCRICGSGGDTTASSTGFAAGRHIDERFSNNLYEPNGQRRDRHVPEHLPKEVNLNR